MANFIWDDVDCFCFDVDSTIIIDEGIDELAKYYRKEDEVKNITMRAMGGSMDFRTALEYRLNIINPTLQTYNKFIESRKSLDLITPGIMELMSLLRNAGKDIYLISGGMKKIIEPIAKELGVKRENVFANRLLFHKDGKYRGFDVNQPTSTQSGKSRVINWLKTHRGYKKVVMIGDGMTDLESSPPADLFIGFGGNVIREEIKRNAPLYFTSFYDIIDYLQEKSVIW